MGIYKESLIEEMQEDCKLSLYKQESRSNIRAKGKNFIGGMEARMKSN